MTYHADIHAHPYPGIAKATLEMSYCNGGINRNRTEAEALRALDDVLAEASVAADLRAVSAWLLTLDHERLLTVVDGEQGEMEQILASAPAGTDMLLNQIFDRAA